MFVGAVKCDLLIHHAGSIKDKRRVVKSVTARLRQRFGASAAEVGAGGRPGHAQIGFSLVSSDMQVLSSAIDRALEFIETADPASELIGREIEVLKFGDD